MWLITYTQNNIIDNTTSYEDENPAQWLYRMCIAYPEVKTVLLFAVEVPAKDARKI